MKCPNIYWIILLVGETVRIAEERRAPSSEQSAQLALVMNPLLSISSFCFAYYACSCTNHPVLIGFLSLLIYLYCERSVAAGSPPMNSRRKLMLASWNNTSEAQIFGSFNINADKLVAYLSSRKTAENKITPTVAVVKALGLAFKDGGSLNCRLAFDTFIPNKSIDISCLVALDDGADLASAKITNADQISLNEVQAQLKKKAEKLRKHQDEDFEASKPILSILPVFIIRPIVELVGWLSSALNLTIAPLGVRANPFGTAMVTSVGMLGVQQGFIPFTPFTRVPLLIMVGAIVKQPIVNENNEIVVANQLNITATVDHRYVDGTAASKVAKKLVFYLENPELLDENLNDAKTIKKQ
jgi:hypothetical protein